MDKQFCQITIGGKPDERGFQHGKQLANRIVRTVEFYADAFGKSENELFRLANRFKRKIQEFNKDYAIEIESIAEGAGINSLYIYALNSRSELLSLDSNECTALYFPSTRILGQNWDWARALEELMVLMRIEQPNGHKIAMVTEPGIIGKIGMNSSGLGVCLNILRIDKDLQGIPVHIVLRAVLDSTNIHQARAAVDMSGNGKASNILVGDQHGDFFDIEFAGDRSLPVSAENAVLVHTNHYVSEHINPDEGLYRCSYSRMRSAKEKLDTTTLHSVADMKSILLDRSDGEFPINRRYTPDDVIEEVGTVCTVIMDLPNQIIHLKKGHSVETDFVAYSP